LSEQVAVEIFELGMLFGATISSVCTIGGRLTTRGKIMKIITVI